MEKLSPKATEEVIYATTPQNLLPPLYSTEEKMKIKIMSHNVWGMYAPDVVKKVANRNDAMQRIYHRELPDVIGTQEFSADIRNHKLQDMIADEYVEVDVTEDVKALEMEWLYTPMFYRPATCELIKKGYVLYDRAFNNHDSKGICWAVFKHIQSGKLFTVCNTHYWWQIGPEHDVARVGNSKDVLRLKAELPEPFFIMGDFNCRSSSEAFDVLFSGGLVDVQKVAKDTCDRTTCHPYPGYDEEKGEFFPANYSARDFSFAIDHVLVDEAHADRVLAFDVLIDDDSLSTSDHCPIYVEFDL